MTSEQFNYNYSALTEAEKREINSIKKRYENKAEEKEANLNRLRKLDNAVKNGSVIPPLCLGIIGCLIFGLGLTMVLTWYLTVWGIMVAVIGCAIMLPAYPLYKILLKHFKEKYGKEILSLSKSLLNEKEN